jgi:hypothetical protein
VLKTPTALSFIVPESRIPSFSRTPSIISDRRGTKIKEHDPPRMAKPIADKYILSGKLNTLDGPNKKSATEAKMKAKNVSQ